MALTTATVNSILDAVYNGGTYTGGTIKMALFTTGLPSGTGVEVSGGSYARQTLTFSAAASGRVDTSANAVFSDLPTGEEIVAFGIYDGASTLIDEKLLDNSFTADLSNNELNVSYYSEI